MVTEFTGTMKAWWGITDYEHVVAGIIGMMNAWSRNYGHDEGVVLGITDVIKAFVGAALRGRPTVHLNP